MNIKNWEKKTIYLSENKKKTKTEKLNNLQKYRKI